MMKNVMDTNDVDFDYGKLKWVQIIEKKERKVYCKWLPYIMVDVYNLWKQYAPKGQEITIETVLKIVNGSDVVFNDKEGEYMLSRAINILNHTENKKQVS